jgi:hypothetical protein
MENKQIVDTILESMRKEVAEFVATQSQITSSTQYEEQVIELSRKFAAGLITKSAGKMPKSRNSKKNSDKSGQV